MRLKTLILCGILANSVIGHAEICQPNQVSENCSVVDIQLVNLKSTYPADSIIDATYVFSSVDGLDVHVTCGKDMLFRPTLWIGVGQAGRSYMFDAMMQIPNQQECADRVANIATGTLPQTVRLSDSTDWNRVHRYYNKIEFLK